MNLERLAIKEANMLNLFIENKTIKELFIKGEARPQPNGRKPVLVIKYGPPASGKGSPPTRAAIESLGVDYDKMIHLNIDDVVESINKFKSASRSKLEETYTYMANMKKSGNEKFKNLVENLNKIDTEKIAEFSKIYFNIRGTPTANGRSIPEIMDTIMGNAMKMNFDISMETTGAFSFPSWLFEEPKLKPYIDNYRVVFVFPTVKLSTAWSRYKSRPASTYLKCGPFRFGSTKSGFAQQYIKSYKSFIEEMPTLMNGRRDVSFIIVPNDPNTQGKKPTVPVKNNSTHLTSLKKFVNDAEGNI